MKLAISRLNSFEEQIDLSSLAENQELKDLLRTTFSDNGAYISNVLMSHEGNVLHLNISAYYEYTYIKSLKKMLKKKKARIVKIEQSIDEQIKKCDKKLENIVSGPDDFFTKERFDEYKTLSKSDILEAKFDESEYPEFKPFPGQNEPFNKNNSYDTYINYEDYIVNYELNNNKLDKNGVPYKNNYTQHIVCIKQTLENLNIKVKIKKGYPNFAYEFDNNGEIIRRFIKISRDKSIHKEKDKQKQNFWIQADTQEAIDVTFGTGKNKDFVKPFLSYHLSKFRAFKLKYKSWILKEQKKLLGLREKKQQANRKRLLELKKKKEVNVSNKIANSLKSISIKNHNSFKYDFLNTVNKNTNFNFKDLHIRIKPLNRYVRKSRIYKEVFELLSGYRTKLFPRNSYILKDLAAISSLVNRKQIDVHPLTHLLGIAFENLHKRTHKIFLFMMEQIMVYFVETSTSYVCGMKMEISGRLGGNNIAKTIKKTQGALAITQVRRETAKSYTSINTIYGTFGLKILVTYDKFKLSPAQRRYVKKIKLKLTERTIRAKKKEAKEKKMNKKNGKKQNE